MISYSRAGKRILDVFVVLLFSPLVLPVLIAVWMVVRIRLGSPAIFVQSRPGLHGKPFDLVKFRTMTHTRDANGALLPDSERLTPLGRWLRETSLDELPELWNVLIGDMSLVGPRPLLMKYLSLYSPAQKRRHNVRPGVTGLAQVSGRNSLSWAEHLNLDAAYAQRVTLRDDLRILYQTMIVWIDRSGIAEPGHATRTEFTGTEDGDTHERE